MPRYRQGSISLFASLPAKWDQDLRMPGNMEIKTVQWSGNSQMRGLIWEQECNSDSVVAADGTLVRTKGFVAHVDFGENCFWNSCNKFISPSCGMRMESSQIARYWSKTSLKYLVEHRQGGIRLGVSDVSQANSLSILFFVYFKENIDYWIGLLGGLALHAFHGGSYVWETPTVKSAEAYSVLLY